MTNTAMAVPDNRRGHNLRVLSQDSRNKAGQRAAAARTAKAAAQQQANLDAARIGAKGKRLGASVEDVRIKDLQIDARYQRPLDENWCIEKALIFKPKLVGVLEASKRKDGTYVIIDGQHRWHILYLLDIPQWKCLVHQGLTFEEEAALFADKNDERRSPKPMATYRARLAARDPETVAIESVLDKNHFRMATRQGLRGLTCVTSIEQIYRYWGGDVLDDALRVIGAAFEPEAATSRRREVVVAVSAFVAQFRGQYDQLRLIQTLSTAPMMTMIGDAKVSAVARGGADWGHLGLSIMERYNRRISQKLGPWTQPKFSHKR